MGSGAAIQHAETGGRSRLPAFLPADLRPDPQGGLYQSLYKRLRGFILDGAWPAGTRVPSSRVLAADLNVSRNTAILAVEQLIADGWAESKSRSGVYVSRTPATAAPDAIKPRPQAELAPFALQRPATDLFPALVWKKLQAQVWAQIEPAHLLAADPAGEPRLREAIARLVCAPRGICCHPDQVLIFPSATLAWDVVAALVVRAGHPVMVQEPGRESVNRIIASRGALLCSLVEHNRRPATGAATFCSTVSTSLAADAPHLCRTHTTIIEQVRGNGGWIIEDDRDSELWFSDEPQPAPLAAQAPEHTILIGSFNRLLFPGLCAAFLVAPPQAAQQLRDAQAATGARVSLASQLALADFIIEGHFARHLRRRHQAYAERRETLAMLLKRQPLNAAGLHLLVKTKSDAAPLADLLNRLGLGGGAMAFMAEGEQHHALAVGLGSPLENIKALAPQLVAALAENEEAPRCTRRSRSLQVNR